MRDRVIYVKVNQEEKKAFHEAAKAEGFAGMSGWLRKVLLDHLRKNKNN